MQGKRNTEPSNGRDGRTDSIAFERKVAQEKKCLFGKDGCNGDAKQEYIRKVSSNAHYLYTQYV